MEKCAQLHEQTHTLGQCLVSFHLLKSKSSVDTVNRTLLRIMFITHKKSDRLPLHQAHADQRRAHCLRLGTFQIEYQKHLRKKKKHINLRLRVVVCPTVYMVLPIPNDAEFQPSTTSIFVTSATYTCVSSRVRVIFQHTTIGPVVICTSYTKIPGFAIQKISTSGFTKSGCIPIQFWEANPSSVQICILDGFWGDQISGCFSSHKLQM